MTPTAGEASLLAYRLRAVRVAAQSTFMAIGVMVAYAFLPGHGPVDRPRYLVLLLVAMVGAALAQRLPWASMFEAGIGQAGLNLWSAVDIVLVTAAIAFSGYAQSDLYVVYALTTVFFAASYPPRAQAGLLLFTVAAYAAALAVDGWELSPAHFTLRCGIIAVTAFMSSFLSKELMREAAAHTVARDESEHRAARLAVVATAARSMSESEADRVLEAVAEGALALGWEASEICLYDEETGIWTSSLHKGIDAGYDRVQPAASGLAGVVRDRRATVTVDDYSAWPSGVAEVRKAGFRRAIASPIFSGPDLVGSLIVGSLSRIELAAYEVEAIELLAAQAGAALLNARRFSERRAFEQQLTYQAYHDALTGLPNRTLFADRLEHATRRAVRDGTRLAVLFLDLDRFKTINDSLGHDKGDRLLQEVGVRLRRCLRPGDTLSRYGGDEFTVLLDPAGEVEASAVAARIQEVLSRPIHLAGRDVFVSASIGIAFAPRPEGSGLDGEPLREADLAMYRAKDRGRDRYELYAPEMNEQARARLEAETDLRRAVDQSEFVLHYQPIRDLSSGETVAVEALVRWNHPRRGLVSPGEFVPLAEETRLIVPLGRWVVEEASRQAMAWADLGLPPFSVSVNVSGFQLDQPNLPAQLETLLAERELLPERLTLEITESVLMDDADGTLAVVNQVRDLGVGLALDDFGRGYSSLGQLKRLPLTSVKVDKGFIQGLGRDGQDRAIVRSIVAIADELGMVVTAEGIESAEQLDQARRLGCQWGQGFYLGRPVPAAALTAEVLAPTLPWVDEAGPAPARL